jgi:hypothetical protein
MTIYPAILESWRSLKDKSYKITYESFELTPEQAAGINADLGKAGFVAFKEDAFKDKEKEFIDTLESDFDDQKKPPSQRLRAVLYRNWEQKAEGYEDFQLYYNFKVEKIITHYKNKLD